MTWDMLIDQDGKQEWFLVALRWCLGAEVDDFVAALDPAPSVLDVNRIRCLFSIVRSPVDQFLAMRSDRIGQSIARLSQSALVYHLSRFAHIRVRCRQRAR